MKYSVVYLKKWAPLFITALIRVTQTDPEREKKKGKKGKEVVPFLIDSLN